jgi:SAM-dependent methyltransferase
MNRIPAYDPRIPKGYYDSFGAKEWERLSRDCTGELLSHVHVDVLCCYVHKKAPVLELGAGAGIFSKELVALAGQLVVSDISEEQLDINKSKIAELGLDGRIKDFLILDITDLQSMGDNQYDVVVCVGGALNYTFDKERAAVAEIVRVAKPGGIVIVGAVALFNSLMRYLAPIVEEKNQFGIEATKWLLDRGIQDAEHYPVENGKLPAYDEEQRSGCLVREPKRTNHRETRCRNFFVARGRCFDSSKSGQGTMESNSC